MLPRPQVPRGKRYDAAADIRAPARSNDAPPAPAGCPTWSRRQSQIRATTMTAAEPGMPLKPRGKAMTGSTQSKAVTAAAVGPASRSLSITAAQAMIGIS